MTTLRSIVMGEFRNTVVTDLVDFPPILMWSAVMNSMLILSLNTLTMKKNTMIMMVMPMKNIQKESVKKKYCILRKRYCRVILMS